MARKILLADDSVTAQNMGRKILADAGYEVITVNNGSAALKKINEHRPDLIVLDVYMPGYSGLEVCQRLKDTGETSRIPVLLTVGKLEPFKPEEAKKARADGFIVKPFEASELLSALSKLEDKVVPRGETSKTGRFARTAPAIEDSRFDKSMAVEEDNGWKSRIVFPKKKEKPVEAEADDPSIYNPVNKDLRTTIESKRVDPAPAAPAQESAAPAPAAAAPAAAAPAASAPAKEEQVDLGALAPTGLPKDVTPEEIAALAAAAAQMKGKLAEEKAPEPAAEMAVVAPAEAEAPNAEAQIAEVKTESPVAESIPAPVAEPAASAAQAATFAEQTVPEKVEEKEPEVAASPAAVSGEIERLEAETSQPQSASSGSSWSPEPPAKSDEPVTMAVATPTNAAPGVSRWTAVAVALAPEESGVSLEQEMQKAYAASAAGDGGSTAVSTAVVEAPPAPALAAIAEPAPAESQAVAAPAVPAAEAAPEAAETMSAVANAATEAISAAVAELESVAAAYVAEKAASAPTEAPFASETSASAPFVNETIEAKPEAKEEPVPVLETPAPAQEAAAEAAKAEEIIPAVEAETATPEVPHAVSEELAKEESKSEELKKEEAREEESKEAAPVVETPVPVAEAPAPAVDVEDRKPEVASEVSEEPAAPVRSGFRAGGWDDMAKRESETAAAWASWRKIRETGSKPAGESALDSEETSEPKDAAMAVAAGAEHNPEDAASLESDPEIASIVDSVLADMRPKIVEEIARKLGKKK